MIAIGHVMVEEEKKGAGIVKSASYTDYLQSPADGVTPKG